MNTCNALPYIEMRERKRNEISYEFKKHIAKCRRVSSGGALRVALLRTCRYSFSTIPNENESSLSPLHNIFFLLRRIYCPQKMLTQNDCCSSNVFAAIEVKRKNAFDFDVKWKCDWWACACTENVSRKRSNGRRIVVTDVEVE